MKSAVGLSLSKNIRNHYRLHVHTTSFLHRVVFLITSMPNFTKIFVQINGAGLAILNFGIYTNPICSIRIMIFIIFSHDRVKTFLYHRRYHLAELLSVFIFRLWNTGCTKEPVIGGLTFIEGSSSGSQLFGITYSSISLKKLFRWISIVHSLQSSILKAFELQKSSALSN